MAAFDPLSLPVVGSGLIFVLLACSAFFSSSEIAIFSVERHRIGVLAERGGPGAVLEALRSDPHRLLVTILVGNNVVNIAMSSVATAILVAAFPAGVAVTVSTVLLTVVVLVFGEIVPKSYGVANAESWALRSAPTLRRFQRAAGPVVSAFDAVTRRLSAAVGGEAGIEAPYVTRDELAALARTAERGGEIDADERAMVESVLGLHTITAGDVMVPRENVVAVDAATSIRDAATLAADERVTRLPVYDGSLDEPRGIVDLRDLERTLALDESVPVERLATPTLTVSRGEPIDALLTRMQDERVRMAIVAGDDGDVVGIVTVGDVLEEVVGDLFDAGVEASVRTVADGVMVRGDVFLNRIDAVFDTAMAADAPAGAETLAGYVYHRLGRVPRADERIDLDGVAVTIEQIDGERIRRMFLQRTAAVDGDGAGDVPGDGSPGDDSLGDDSPAGDAADDADEE
ncbi:hemolysin family protein [Halobaculum sp. CBA1158]|uniref:hemolysin family protein n=1 Tax=Halobaculum sp. CBA1158 TaxID=2904243 RepID=UPI001F238347|nr:hemolysin family protein [Halobaculum sp. CBA1158]UIO99772.1 hemolysin family protein [Halobaculum sp. CBA1158]